jgi:hypothetical protein
MTCTEQSRSIKRALGLIVCLLALLPVGCIQISSGVSTLPTVVPTAIVPTPELRADAASDVEVAVPQPITTLPPALETAVPPPTVFPTPTSVISAKPSLPTATTAVKPVATTAVDPVETTRVIGYSTGERPLTDYQFGSGPTHIVFVGGIHGGYEWNTILLAYDLIDYFRENPALIPAEVTLHIIPAANPDGQYLVTGREGRFSLLDVAADSLPGRVNGGGVDLNRNWDCDWTANALWRDQPTSGGSLPFSEPETIALRDFILELNPVAVTFWHSAANGVFAAGCPGTYQPSLTLAEIYGRAAGYPVYETFTSYPVTGDASNWLALQGIASVSVELINHENTDWAKNLAGVTAVLRQFNQINQ